MSKVASSGVGQVRCGKGAGSCFVFTGWTHLEHLMVASGPVVQHHEAEDVFFRFRDGHAFAVWDGLADEVAHFELVVHLSSRSNV